MYSTRSASPRLTPSCCAVITQTEAHTGRPARLSQVPRRPLTVAVECSGCFIACGSNCTYIWRSFVVINPHSWLSVSPPCYKPMNSQRSKTCDDRAKRSPNTPCVFGLSLTRLSHTLCVDISLLKCVFFPASHRLNDSSLFFFLFSNTSP